MAKTVERHARFCNSLMHKGEGHLKRKNILPEDHGEKEVWTKLRLIKSTKSYAVHKMPAAALIFFMSRSRIQSGSSIQIIWNPKPPCVISLIASSFDQPCTTTLYIADMVPVLSAPCWQWTRIGARFGFVTICKKRIISFSSGCTPSCRGAHRPSQLSRSRHGRN